MAAATRLTEPLRTSPTAKIPGLFVSGNRGVRVLFSSWVAGMPRPVSRNPCPSWASWPANHLVPRVAPMKTNSPVTARSVTSGWPSRRGCTPRSRPVPVRAVTWVDGQTTMRGLRSIR
jgi:hypothetical protein